jgi:hypothetical protein
MAGRDLLAVVIGVRFPVREPRALVHAIADQTSVARAGILQVNDARLPPRPGALAA